MNISIDLVRDLPLVVEAYENKQLQFQTRSKDWFCKYSGPCAIGVMLTPKQKEYIECGEFKAIYSLLLAKIIVAPKEQIDDIRQLQQAHDSIQM